MTMRLALILPAACAILVAATPRVAAQSPAAAANRGLSIHYADGRTVTNPLRSTGGMWTPLFPRIRGAQTSRDGIPLTELDLRWVIEGPEVVVTVTLFYGGPNRNPLKAAVVRVAPDGLAVVNELRDYGVEPITLSIVTIPPTVAYAPDVSSVSGQLEVRAEPLAPDVLAYRVFLTNRSTLPLIWVQFRAYRGDRLAIEGIPRGKRNLPFVLPGESGFFDIRPGAVGRGTGGDAPEIWQPLDRIAIVSLMWQDGLVEGDPTTAATRRGYDEGRAVDLRRLLEVLRAAREQPVTTLKTALVQTILVDGETKVAKDEMLAEVEALEKTGRSKGGEGFAAWLLRTTAETQQWLARIVLPKS
jgi:hypothetical protein